MVDSKSYPQIPSTVWWGMRSLLKKSPNSKFDEQMLAASLSVQTVAARQYVGELKKVGILDEDGKATDLAGRWRLDDSYSEAVSGILSESYPESLVTIAPPGLAERNVVVNWFMQQGLGQGSAKNKAATYMLLSSQTPNDDVQSGAKQKATTKRDNVNKAKPNKPNRDTAADEDSKSKGKVSGDMETMPLNVNVQIHISADASNDQIDSIFKSMRQHLYNG